MEYQLHHGDCLEVLAALPDCSVDAIVTDPPYGLSFMGKRWDYDVPTEAVWVECLRVLKPGGHLLAFAGTRTQHRMAVRIEDAGFEIRDMIAWVYGQGFPKSMDISKQLDKMDASQEQEQRRFRFTEWVRSTGVTAKQIDDATATKMGSHYTTHPTQPAIMTREHLEACRGLLGSVPEWVEKEADIRSVESKNFAEREVVGRSENGISSEFNLTAPATEAAKQWEGWGTALKPALEPITLARKPLIGTVAANVLEHGTGGLNIGACRVAHSEDCRMMAPSQANIDNPSEKHRQAGRREAVLELKPEGRWPANFIHDGSKEVLALLPEVGGGKFAERTTPANRADTYSGFDGCSGKVNAPNAYGDSGSAARFFYCAKASRDDRNEGCGALPLQVHQSGMGGAMPIDDDGKDRDRFKATSRNPHPTVKPTDLMRYLCRLITPPNGIVLDPFMGSGSTGKAAMAEGFRFIGIEREAEYIEIARARISAEAEKPRQLSLF
jgi:DNA modification methylase